MIVAGSKSNNDNKSRRMLPPRSSTRMRRTQHLNRMTLESQCSKVPSYLFNSDEKSSTPQQDDFEI
ncbi:hypothetical protein TSUD_29190 [Trifolium subterraneum]|uniref:Uncharacterized protein n=1 Tax=Trifolium subterraneum TaxID=3900 RepID=A0A2Z6MXJ0_TRISU|nr:hypothetical protein TSUD_29190 [Trifolium subterraneum]